MGPFNPFISSSRLELESEGRPLDYSGRKRTRALPYETVDVGKNTSALQIQIFVKKMNLKGGPSNRPTTERTTDAADADVASRGSFLRTLSIQLVSFYPSQPKRGGGEGGKAESKRKRFRGGREGQSTVHASVHPRQCNGQCIIES